MNSTLSYMISMVFLFMISLQAQEQLEPFEYPEKEIKVGPGFAAVESSDFVPEKLDGQSFESFVSHQFAEDTNVNGGVGFEDIVLEKASPNQISAGFEETDSKPVKRTLTEKQKGAEKVLKGRMIEEKRKQDIWWKLQESKLLEQRRSIWKSYEQKADAFSTKPITSQQSQKSAQQQSLFQKIQESQAQASAKEAVARELADKLAKISAQRYLTAQQITAQQSALKRRDVSTPQGKRIAARVRSDVQERSNYLLYLNKQYRDIDQQLGQARKEAQSIREEVDKLQKDLDVVSTILQKEEY